MTREIGRGARRTRKRHQCFQCYRSIPIGTEAAFFTGAMDDYAYTLYSHPDCQEAADDYFSTAWPDDYWEGYPPLRDALMDSGEYEFELARMRGLFPHVVCRMELTEQLHEARHADPC